MLMKVWFMLVLCSVLMVSGCSGGMPKDNMDSVAVLGDVVSDLIMAEAEQVETTVTEEQSGDSSNVEASNTEEPTADMTTTEADAESETVTTQPATPPMEQQPTTLEQTTSSTEAPATEDNNMPPDTDDRGNSADGSPVFEITFNIPQAEYVGYDADRVARLAVEKCKAAGMITLPENLDRLLAEGKITQEEYDEYYPYDGCGYYSVFVETNLNLASTISGERLCSEEEIADYIAGMMVLEVEPYFYIECAGVYQGNSVEFYEFRCYR